MGKILLERADGVSTIYFNRPDHYNALDMEMLQQLLTKLKEVEINEDRVLVLAGKGKAFSAGGDVKMMQTLDRANFDELMNTLSEIATTLYMMPKIVIAAVGGSAAGLGLSIALAADYVVAGKDATFGMLFAGVGLIPDGGGHFFLQERIGTHKAKQFIWGLEQLDAKAAASLGIVDISAEDERAATRKLTMKVLHAPFKAVVRSKQILHQAKLPQLLEILKEEKAGQMMAAETADHQEGVHAFAEKRTPKFTGA